MDIKDAKVGMLVKFNSHYTGTMRHVLEYMRETGEPLVVGSVSKNYIRVWYRGGEYGFYPDAFVPYQDPEADMVVWDALEVGEHFIVTTSQEAVKITKTQFVVLGSAGVHTVVHSRIGQLIKFKLA